MEVLCDHPYSQYPPIVESLWYMLDQEFVLQQQKFLKHPVRAPCYSRLYVPYLEVFAVISLSANGHKEPAKPCGADDDVATIPRPKPAKPTMLRILPTAQIAKVLWLFSSSCDSDIAPLL